jgi:dipeptidyl aminopeptidase/acylaminoacyl peptidase
MIYDFLGGTPEEKSGNFKAASPVTYIDKDDAPILMFMGTKDRLVPYNQAYELANAMTKAGLGGRIELILGADHGWGGAELARTGATGVAFFNEQLRK